MSQLGTPTLSWAIPMYQLMQESLAANIVDHSLPSRMCTACWKALDKVEHYYDMAQITSVSLQRVSTANLPVGYDTILTLMASSASCTVTILV